MVGLYPPGVGVPWVQPLLLLQVQGHAVQEGLGAGAESQPPPPAPPPPPWPHEGVWLAWAGWGQRALAQAQAQEGMRPGVWWWLAGWGLPVVLVVVGMARAQAGVRSLLVVGALQRGRRVRHPLRTTCMGMHGVQHTSRSRCVDWHRSRVEGAKGVQASVLTCFKGWLGQAAPLSVRGKVYAHGWVQPINTALPHWLQGTGHPGYLGACPGYFWPTHPSAPGAGWSQRGCWPGGRGSRRPPGGVEAGK